MTAPLWVLASECAYYDDRGAKYWLWYPVCLVCRAEDPETEGEGWYGKDPRTGRFGRSTWTEALDMGLSHLKESHGPLHSS